MNAFVQRGAQAKQCLSNFACGASFVTGDDGRSHVFEVASLHQLARALWEFG